MRVRSCLALCAVTLATPAFAQTTETRMNADVSSSIGYSNNPFSTTGSDTGAGFVQVDIRPQLRILREHSALTINADANVQQYFNRYTRSDNYSGGVDYNFVPAEYVRAHLNASVQSSLIGSTNDLANRFATVPQPGTVPSTDIGPAPVDPINMLPVNTGTDIGLFGLGARRRTINGGGDVTATLSARDVVTGSAFVINSKFSNSGSTGVIASALGDYTGYGGTVGYSRQITGYVQGGLQGSVAKYDYEMVGGDTNVYSIQATTTARINEYWTLNGALGVSFINREVGGSTAALSGSLAMCRRGIRVNYCINANRAVLPTGAIGTQVSTSVGGSYAYRITERSNINTSADYSKNSTPSGMSGTVTPVALSNEYLRATIGYDQQLRQRLRLIGSVNYRKIFGGSFIGGNVIGGSTRRPSDFGGLIGVAVRLGDIR